MIHKLVKVRGADFCDDQFPVISTIGRGPKGEKGEKGDSVSDEEIYNSVSKYFSDHPEYTTTIPDDSIMKSKLNSSLIDYIDNNSILAFKGISTDYPKYIGWTKSPNGSEHLQSGCMIDDNVWVQSFIDGNGGDTGYLVVYNYNEDTADVKYVGSIGHCNGMAFDSKRNKLYLATYNQQSGTNFNTLLVIDVNSDDYSMTNAHEIRVNWNYNGMFQIRLTGIGYDESSDTVYICSPYCSYFAIIDANSFDYIESIEISTAIKTDFVDTTEASQTLACNNGYLYYIHGRANAITVYSAKDGSYVGSKAIGIYNTSMLRIGEVEGGCFFDGKFYLCAYLLGASDWCYGQVLELSIGPNVTAQTHKDTIYVNPQTTTYKGDGSSSSLPLPHPHIVNNMEYSDVTTLRLQGSYTLIPSLLFISNRVHLYNFNGATGIREVLFIGCSGYVASLVLNGIPSDNDAALTLQECGSMEFNSLNLSESILSMYDIALVNTGPVSIMNTVQRLVSDEPQSVLVNRTRPTPLFVTNSQNAIYTISTVPSLTML